MTFRQPTPFQGLQIRSEVWQMCIAVGKGAGRGGLHEEIKQSTLVLIQM